MGGRGQFRKCQLAAFGNVWVEWDGVNVFNPVSIQDAVNPRDDLGVFRPSVVKSEDDGGLGELPTSAASPLEGVQECCGFQRCIAGVEVGGLGISDSGPS